MDMAYFDAQVAQLHAQMPALSRAVPPAAAVRQSGTHSMSAPEVFAAIDPGTFRLRALAESPVGLVGPFRGHGDCLDPLLPPGSLTWFDPRMPAEDGDLVLVQWHPRTLSGIIRRGCRDAQWLAQYGGQPPPIATKMLRHLAGDHYLVTRESLLRLGRNRILGVLRYALGADGVPLYGSGAPGVAHQIGNNAATVVLNSSLVGPITYPASGSTVYVPALLVFTPAYDCILQAPAAWDVSVSGGPLVGGGVVKLDINGGTVTDDALGTIDSGARRFNAQANLSVTRGTACQVEVQIPNPTLNTTIQNVSLRVEQIRK